jgi:ribonuclease Z
MGLPEVISNITVDTAHTVHYAVGYLTKQVNPRLAMVTHTAYDEDLLPEILAGIRVHWDGLFQFGAPDGVVVNVTKEAVWTRNSALSEAASPARPSPSEAKELFDLGPRHLNIEFPDPRHDVADVQEEFVREKEIDPDLYYPEDVKRDLVRVFPRGFKIEIPKMVAQKLGEKIKRRFGRD